MKALYLSLIVLIVVGCKDKTASMESNAQTAKQETIDSMRVVLEKQRVIDSMQQEAIMTDLPQDVSIEQVAPTEQTNSGAQSTTTTTTQKKGWSSTAKGAVLGAGVGAATGAIISKKKGQGAIIGGLAGAGVGAGTGAIIDGSKKE